MDKKTILFKNFVGIDISKLTLDYCLINEDQKVILKGKVENNIIGIKSMIKALHTDAEQTMICVEHTGVYGNLLCDILTKYEYKLWVVAALEIKKSMGITRGKSDTIDAKRIALFACQQVHKFKSYVMPEPEIAELKLLNTERNKLIEAIKSFQCTSECFNYYSKEILDKIKKINKKTLELLEKQLKTIESEISKIQKNNKKISQQMNLMQSIPGIGPQTSLMLILTTNGFREFPTWRKMACYAGCAPFEYSSGTSVRGRTKVHIFADKKLKSNLHLCVLNNLKNNAEMKHYYERKKEEGKHSMLIINNLKCKLLSRIYAVIKRETPYVDTFKFAQ